MSTSSFKKISAAALAVVLGLSAVSHGATIYSTGFETADGYATGSLNLQGGFTQDSGSTGPASGAQVVNSSTVVAPGVIIDGSQSVQLSVGGTGNTTTPIYNDFERAVPTATVADSLTATFAINTANVAEDNFFGFSLVDTASDATVASILLTAQGGTPVEQLFNGVTSAYSNAVGTTDPVSGTYSITLDADDGKYFVTDPGGNVATGLLPTGLNGAPLSIDLASQDQGVAGSATFDDITVSTPEPASIAMVSLGGLMLLAKRPKKRLA